MERVTIPDVYYSNPQEVFDIKREKISEYIQTEYPGDSIVTYETYIDSNGNDRVRWTIAGQYASNGMSFYLRDTGASTQEFSSVVTAHDQFIVHEWFGKFFYLRIDGATNNLESQELNTANIDPARADELLHSDILAAPVFGRS